VDALLLFEPSGLTSGVTTQSSQTISTRFGWSIGAISSALAALTTIAAVVIQSRGGGVAGLRENYA